MKVECSKKEDKQSYFTFLVEKNKVKIDFTFKAFR